MMALKVCNLGYLLLVLHLLDPLSAQPVSDASNASPSDLCNATGTAFYVGFNSAIGITDPSQRRDKLTTWVSTYFADNSSLCSPAWHCMTGVNAIVDHFAGFAAPGNCVTSEPFTVVNVIGGYGTDGSIPKANCAVTVAETLLYVSQTQPNQLCSATFQELAAFDWDIQQAKIGQMRFFYDATPLNSMPACAKEKCF
eukprot:TRINITY_DN12654_c2_g8_i1.p2 TRINITY_DN12654_c2_g8~~TRINITY_DN12654_c2_g8_i1.p2  ORF type:complete len:197 (+),score=24.49 TRINITY_DN12654_c2_g8_i1:1912-2502(+)